MAYSNLPVLERFFKKVQVPDNPDDCWIWIGGKLTSGYGKFTFNKRQGLAHRFSYAHFVAPIPDEMNMCHACDTPSCVNPSHLFVGTQKDNIADARQKGRLAFGERNGAHTHPERVPRGKSHPFARHPEKAPRGETHGSAKLTEVQVREIRRRYAAGGTSYSSLGREYNVNAVTISDAVRRRCWQHID